MVGLVEPKLKLWITALVGVCLGLGFFGFLIAIFLVETVLRGRGGPPSIIWFIVGALVNGTAVWLVLGYRRRFCAQALNRRVMLAIGTWLVSIGSVVAIVVSTI